MTRLGAVFWGGLVLASGFATFNVKYAVQGIEDELARVRRQTIAEQQEIRVLSAEWAYLNQPDRLAELNRNFLQLAPMTTKQLQGRVDEIALRAPPAGMPDTMPHAMVAANPAMGGLLTATPAVESPLPATLAAVAPSVPPAAAPAHATHAGGAPVTEVLMAKAPAGGAPTIASAGTDINGAEGQHGNSAGEAQLAGASGDRAVALAEALHLLGIDAGGQTPLVWLAKAAPIAAAQAAESHGADLKGNTKGAETRAAAAASGTARAADTSSDGAAALAEARRLLGTDIGGQTSQVRLAKTAPVSLDALVSKIADTR
jgi:hypothetical protein